ncbi:uncharacterized protein LOC144952447 [Lampetra fluviatilis]
MSPYPPGRVLLYPLLALQLWLWIATGAPVKLPAAEEDALVSAVNADFGSHSVMGLWRISKIKDQGFGGSYCVKFEVRETVCFKGVDGDDDGGHVVDWRSCDFMSGAVPSSWLCSAQLRVVRGRKSQVSDLTCGPSSSEEEEEEEEETKG